MRFSICVTVDRAWIFSDIYRMTEELVSDYRMVSIPHNLNVPVPLLHVTPPTPPYLASIVCYQTKAKKSQKEIKTCSLTSSGSGGFPTAHTSSESRVKSSSPES